MGRFVKKKQLKRKQVLSTMANLEPCLIVMEACGGANYWARAFIALGHQVKLIAPQYVKPYVKGNKNDYNDAEAIAEAAQRPILCPLRRLNNKTFRICTVSESA
jgi:transposase